MYGGEKKESDVVRQLSRSLKLPWSEEKEGRGFYDKRKDSLLSIHGGEIRLNPPRGRGVFRLGRGKGNPEGEGF